MEMSRVPLLVLRRSFSVVRGGRKPPAAATKAVATVPDGEWSPVVDKKSGLTYYWNKATGRTTALGELPPDGRAAAAPPFGQRPTSFARTMVEMTAWGAGVALAVSAVRAVLG